MHSTSPSLKALAQRAKYLLFLVSLASCIGWLSGCAALSIPSYRNGNGSPFPAGDSELAEEVFELQDEAECDEANYVPAFPTLPTPKFIQRWKEQKSLPEGPSGLRFHPLPTRPMFSQKPNAQTQLPTNGHFQSPAMTGGSVVIPGQTVLDGSGGFGSVPRGAQWSELSQPSAEEISSGLNATGEPKKVAPQPPQLQPKPAAELPIAPDSSEELPAPKNGP